MKHTNTDEADEGSAAAQRLIDYSSVCCSSSVTKAPALTFVQTVGLNYIQLL